jgi:hypothetical protein
VGTDTLVTVGGLLSALWRVPALSAFSASTSGYSTLLEPVIQLLSGKSRVVAFFRVHNEIHAVMTLPHCCPYRQFGKVV